MPKNNTSDNPKQKPAFLYIPWIKGQGDQVVKSLKSDQIRLVPFPLLDIFKHHFQWRHNPRSFVMKLGREHPIVFKRYVLQALQSIDIKIQGLILTLDWPGGLRNVAEIFNELGIPVILIPHESVFADLKLFYTCPVTGANTPVANHILVWGNLQRQIFMERGVPEHRIEVVGSTKLDIYHDYQCAVSREEFCCHHQLNPTQKIILFALQPLDSQFDEDKAMQAQNQAVLDTLTAAQRLDAQVILRLPPSRDQSILDPSILKLAESLQYVTIDGLPQPNKPKTRTWYAHEAIYHADLVLSVNSTMLMEAALLNTPSISLGYTDFNFFWHLNAGIPLARHYLELESLIRHTLAHQQHTLSEAGHEWLRWAFSPGDFDGQAAQRITRILTERYPQAYSLPHAIATTYPVPQRRSVNLQDWLQIKGRYELRLWMGRLKHLRRHSTLNRWERFCQRSLAIATLTRFHESRQNRFPWYWGQVRDWKKAFVQQHLASYLTGIRLCMPLLKALNPDSTRPGSSLPPPCALEGVMHSLPQAVGCFSATVKRQVNLAAFFNARQVVLDPTLKDAAGIDFIVAWGLGPNTQMATYFARCTERPLLYVEDGFLRSIRLGVEGAAPLSVVVDDQGLYYDATRPSRLEAILNGGESPDPLEDPVLLARARRLIKTLVTHRLSKYNHAPDLQKPIRHPNQKTVLVVDQTRGDYSIALGGASQETFDIMLEAALTENPDADILVKVHPDVISGRKKGNFSVLPDDPRIRLYGDDVNPMSLLEQVDSVYVVTSQLGMDALLMGKPVTCFGMPFYAGWGLTQDRLSLPRRHTTRSLEQLVAAAYLLYAIYLNPWTNRQGEIEDVLDYLIQMKQSSREHAAVHTLRHVVSPVCLR